MDGKILPSTTENDSNNDSTDKEINASIDEVLNDISPRKQFKKLSDGSIIDNHEHIFNDRYYEEFEVQIENTFMEILSNSLQEKDFYLFNKKEVELSNAEYDEETINEYLGRSQIYKKSPILYLQYLQNLLKYYSYKIDINKIENFALKQLNTHFISLAKARAYLLPEQIIIGILFLFIKNSLRSRSKFSDFLFDNPITKKSEQTIRNYMKLASLLQYDWFEKYIHTDLTNLYALYDVIQRANDFEKKIFFKYTDPILQCLNDLVASSKSPKNISEYSLLLEYFIRLKKDFKGFNVDKALFYKLYLLNYRFTNNDIKFIKKYSITSYPNSKSVYINDVNFINEYFKKLIKYGGNREKTQTIIDSEKNNIIVSQNPNSTQNNANQIIQKIADKAQPNLQENIKLITTPSIKKDTPQVQQINLNIIPKNIEVFSNILTKFEESCSNFIEEGKEIKQYDFDVIQKIKEKLKIIEQRKEQ